MSDPWSAFVSAPEVADAPPPPPPPDPNGPPVQRVAAQPDAWAAFSPQAAPARNDQGAGQATGAGYRGFTNAETGAAYNDAQQATYADMAKRGSLDRNAAPGSEAFPKAQTNPVDMPKPGDWYVDLQGVKKQVPPDPWSSTAAHALVDAANAGGADLAPTTKDPRWEAIKSGALSGLLLGGKNELESAVASLPKIGDGLPAYLGRFDTELAGRDAVDDQQRQNFPIARGTAAVLGAAAPSLVFPEAAGISTGGRLALNAGQGGVGGFLSTNGDWADRGKGAALGAVSGVALGEVLPRALGVLPRTVTPATRDAANAALGDLGLSAGNLNPETQAMLDGMLSKGADPVQAVRSLAASSLPTPVPLTLGQVTGLPEDQLAFNMAMRGARGPVPAARAQAFARGQQDALRGNVADIASSIAGGSPPLHGQGAMGVSNDLNDLYGATKSGVDAAYNAARGNPSPAVLPQYDAQATHGAVSSALSDFDPLNVPRVAREVDRLGQLATGDISLKDLFASRSRLSTLRASNDPVEAKAAGVAVGQMDRSVNDALSADLFHGDPASVQQWKNAIGQRADFGQLFDQGDLVDRLTQRTGTGGQRRLVVDPGDAANYILGRSDLGFVGRQNLYTDLSKVKTLVSPDSWNALLSEIFQRIANQGEGGVENGAQQFSGAKFQKAWNTAQQRDPRLIDTVFTPNEQQQISQFAGVASRVTSPVKGGDNPSNTSVATKALRFAGNGVLHLMDSLPLIKDVSGSIEHISNNILTTRALKGQPVIAPSPLLPLLPGRAGAYAGSRMASPQQEPQF